MRLPSIVASSFLAAFLIHSQCLAGTGTGVGFDPTPLQIPLAVKSAPRPMTSMDLLTMNDIYGLSISPDGRSVAFVAGKAVYNTNSYETGLFVVATRPRSTPLSLGTAGMPHWDASHQWVPEPPQWSPDSRYITYRMRTHPTDKWQVWRWSRNGGKPVPLTRVAGDVESHQWVANGASIIFIVQTGSAAHPKMHYSGHGILYDGSFPAWEGLCLAEETLQTHPSEEEMWIHDVGTSAERKATNDEKNRNLRWMTHWGGTQAAALLPPRQDSHIDDVKISPDGQHVVYRYYIDDPSRSKTVRWTLLSKPIHGDSPVEITPDAFYVDQFWWSPHGRRIYYTEYAGDGRPWKLMVVPAEGGTPRQVIDDPDLLSDYSVDSSGMHAACIRQSSTMPPSVALANLADGTVTTLVDLNPAFHHLQLSPAARIEGTNIYGESWFGHLVKPLNYETGKRYPLIITTYRGGAHFLRGGSGNEYPIQVLAANGFAVLNLDVGYRANFPPGDFQHALLQWDAPLATIKAAILQLTRLEIVDPQRVGLTGFSHGAEILEYAISHTDMIRAAVESGSGARDPYFYYMANNQWRELFSQWGLGWPEGPSKTKWQQMSPTLNAARIVTPLRINSPDSELLAALPLYTSLKVLGKPIELFVYTDEAHEKNQPRHRFEIYERNVEWFEFWLKGERESGTEKDEQYTRWCQLQALEKRNGDHEDPCRRAQSSQLP